MRWISKTQNFHRHGQSSRPLTQICTMKVFPFRNHEPTKKQHSKHLPKTTWNQSTGKIVGHGPRTSGVNGSKQLQVHSFRFLADSERTSRDRESFRDQFREIKLVSFSSHQPRSRVLGCIEHRALVNPLRNTFGVPDCSELGVRRCTH